MDKTQRNRYRKQVKKERTLVLKDARDKKTNIMNAFDDYYDIETVLPVEDTFFEKGVHFGVFGSLE